MIIRWNIGVLSKACRGIWESDGVCFLCALGAEMLRLCTYQPRAVQHLVQKYDVRKQEWDGSAVNQSMCTVHTPRALLATLEPWNLET